MSYKDLDNATPKPIGLWGNTKVWLYKRLLMNYILKLLNLLPLNGLKTILGIAVVVLSELAKLSADTDTIAIYTALADILREQGAVALPVGLGTVIVGIIHKLLKKKEDTIHTGKKT